MFLRRDKHSEEVTPDVATGPPSALSDEALVQAARELSEDAWTEIYARHVEQVYAYIYFRIGDRQAAEDLAADVFLRAIAGIQTYQWRGTPLLAWLYRIAHNTTIDYRKQMARRSERESQAEMPDIKEPVDMLSALDDRNDMMDAIHLLTDDQQQVLILRFYGGMSNAQVASVVGKPETAVKALQARGLRTLRRILSEDGRKSA